jgi:hypothetical protein
VGLTAPAALAAGRASAPTINLVNLEAPTAAKPETGNFAAFNQTVNRRLVAVQVLGQIFDRYDFLSHFSVQHTLTLKQTRGTSNRGFAALTNCKQMFEAQNQIHHPMPRTAVK